MVKQRTKFWVIALMPAFDGHPAISLDYFVGFKEGPRDYNNPYDTNKDLYFAKWWKEEKEQEVFNIADSLLGTLSCTWTPVLIASYDPVVPILLDKEFK